MITDLRLQHFRSFSDDSFELSPGVNIIVGPNASGKTNLLESILVLARGVSYRARDSELIQFSRPWARIDGHSDKSAQRTVKLVAEPAQSKTYEIDGKSFKRLSPNNSLPVVLFEPEHLRLFSGGPERRREYLDDLLEQTTAGYGTTRRQYKRALAQRNRLLKQSSHVPQTELFPWNVRLSQLAGVIARARGELAGQINGKITGLYKELSQTRTKVNLNYANRWPIDTYESQLLKKLETSQADDHLRGFTGSGPHREDLLITFNGHPSQETASRGEVRTAVLALKIIELQIIETANNGRSPLLLLDDVFSELDGRRRHALTDYLAPYQTFITTTDADIVLRHFSAHSNVIPLSVARG
ncbi:MAG TPA: DNA replication and repair protein RecF [Candidatus Saccharimonadales bacterium]